MKGLRLYKCEKLCSATAVEALFGNDDNVGRALKFPLRAVWRVNPARHGLCARFLIMVPKRRIRHAVDRVTLRRRIREAYRLNRHILDDAGIRSALDIAFVYVDNSIRPSADIHAAMTRLLEAINRSTTHPSPSDDAPTTKL